MGSKSSKIVTNDDSRILLKLGNGWIDATDFTPLDILNADPKGLASLNV